MKRAILLPLGLIALLATAVASAAPATFVFNTSGFDFTDYSLTAGYLDFAMNGDQLQVNLSSTAGTDTIPAITLWVPGPTTSATGATVYPKLANITDISVTSNGAQATGFTVTHDSVALSAVADAYVQSLTALGFKATPQASTNDNLMIYTFDRNGSQIRAVFHREGSNVSAHLSGASAA